MRASLTVHETALRAIVKRDILRCGDPRRRVRPAPARLVVWPSIRPVPHQGRVLRPARAIAGGGALVDASQAMTGQGAA